MKAPKLYCIVICTYIMLSSCGEQGRSADTLPPTGFVGNSLAGEPLYRRYCARCHGKEMDGTHHGPSLHDAHYQMEKIRDLAFYVAVKKGVEQRLWQYGNMPPLPQLNPKEVAHIVAFVRKRQAQAN